jgi:hypothetical protein
MKFFYLISLMVCFSCATAPKKPKSEGMVFAKKIFDIFENMANKQLNAVKDDKELSVTKASLPKTFDLAVYFIPASEEKPRWFWERKTKDEVIAQLAESSRTRQVFELFPTRKQIKDPLELRQMAAQQGADALLLINGAASVATSANAKAISYVAILPIFFVEGNTVEGNFLSQAILWDVRKPIIHFGLESEGNWQMDRPLIFRQPERVLRKSQDASLEALSGKIRQRLMESSPPQL